MRCVCIDMQLQRVNDYWLRESDRERERSSMLLFEWLTYAQRTHCKRMTPKLTSSVRMKWLLGNGQQLHHGRRRQMSPPQVSKSIEIITHLDNYRHAFPSFFVMFALMLSLTHLILCYCFILFDWTFLLYVETIDTCIWHLISWLGWSLHCTLSSHTCRKFD